MSRLVQFPTPFVMVRREDVSGVSGTGKVIEGVIFSDGTVSYHWVVGEHQTHTTANSIDDVIAIHGHDGKTTVEYWDWADKPDAVRLERQWVCQVMRTGYHNGSVCFPSDPHANWQCGYRWEASLTDEEYQKAVKRSEGQSFQLGGDGEWVLVHEDGSEVRGKLPEQQPSMVAGDTLVVGPRVIDQ